MEPISTAIAVGGLLGSAFGKSQEEINAEYYRKIRRKQRKTAMQQRNKELIAMDTKNKANKAGLVAVNERIQRQQGILGTSVGAENINKGFEGLANAYNTSRADLDVRHTKRLGEINQIVAPPEQSNEDLYGGLLAYGLENAIGSFGEMGNKSAVETARTRAKRRSRTNNRGSI